MAATRSSSVALFYRRFQATADSYVACTHRQINLNFYELSLSLGAIVTPRTYRRVRLFALELWYS